MKDKLFFRTIEIDERAIDKDKRTVDVSFSSETPVKRWFGDEYLLHGEKNIDLSRLKRTGAALFRHDSSIIVGALKNIRVDEMKGRATIRFDEDDDGEKYFKKVQSGSLKGVSVGYLVDKFREVLNDETLEINGKTIRGPAMVAEKWSPYEISLTAIPADTSVGVGRDLTRSLDGIEIIHKTKKEEVTMTREEILAIIQEGLAKFQPPKVEDIAARVVQMIGEQSKPKMRVSEEVALDLTGRAGAVSPECKSTVSDMVLQGKTEAECLRFITDEAAKKNPADTKDNGGLPGGNGYVPTRQNPGQKTFKTLKDVDDDTLARSLSSPQLFVQ